MGEQTVRVHLSGRGIAYYIPGCAALTPELRNRLSGAAVAMFDGTLSQDDEMVLSGLSPKTGKRTGHMSMSGLNGLIASFGALEVGQKVFIHVNNTECCIARNLTAACGG